MFILSIIIGIFLVVISIILIRREFKKSLNLRVSKLGDFSDVEKRKIIEVIEELEDEINELNRAFYEIVNDLEGKYSIHEKQIELIEENLERHNNKKEVLNTRPMPKKSIEKPYEEKVQSISAQINDLQNKGYSLAEIAKEFDMGIGEVRLLLNFNKNSN